MEEEKTGEVRRGQPIPGTFGLPGRPINPYLIGAGFLEYCESQGWVATDGTGAKKRYYLTREGELRLKDFGIKI